MIIIPMAGMSSRFFKAGYTKPKYMLEVRGLSLFEHSVNSFKRYFKKELFVFIIKNSFDTYKFVEDKIFIMGIKNYEIIVLDKDTRGQAETVALGLEKLELRSNLSMETITIFNIDTIRPNFVFPKLDILGSGYLEVFIGDGDNWSYVKPKNSMSTIITKSVEKERISDLCCTGLYHFHSYSLFKEAYLNYLNKPKAEWAKGELYIAPLYNYLIDNGLEIHFNKIERTDVIFCGTPDEYIEFKC
ncbi:capsular biosynthesis protein [Shewanella scandinavica]|uniref:capsular biosynthesis protein n=1 Tax=Shewanella scandinavica TaxID=3063538 RepID=UPI0031955DED